MPIARLPDGRELIRQCPKVIPGFLASQLLAGTPELPVERQLELLKQLGVAHCQHDVHFGESLVFFFQLNQSMPSRSIAN